MSEREHREPEASGRFVPLSSWIERRPEEMRERARAFYEDLRRRRTVREFSDRPIPEDVIEDCILAAGTAPSGAHMQPWHFAVVRDPELKRRIRVAAEAEERQFYGHRAPEEWLAALRPLGTDARKPFLETAPCLVAIFARSYGVEQGGERTKHYYVQESVGIATGMLITAMHHAGLVMLTHTPSPMGFLGSLLERPANERPFLLLVAGYPAPGARVPALERKPIEDIATFFDGP